MTRSASTAAGKYVCTSVWTNEASEEPAGDEYRRLLAIILASIFGATILIAVVAIAVVVLRRHCARRPRKTVDSSPGLAAAQSRTTRPQIGYASKRFAKDHGSGAQRPRTVSAVSGGADRPMSDAFTAEERAKIVAMLAGTSVPGYSNVAYNPGSTEFAAESNGNVYDAIPDELFDVPLDSPV